MNFVTKIRATFRKNYPEIKTFISGQYPGFVYGKESIVYNVPVFVFHEVEPDTFEEKLIYLKENGYKTLDSFGLLDYLENPEEDHSRKVVLTFDDGHISLWQHAYQLLKKFDFKAVSFICPGLIQEEGKDKIKKGKRKLCNWDEIKKMHVSGYIDFQSHGMRHDLVFTSSKLVNFFYPHFHSSYLGKREKAVILRNGEGFSITNLCHYEGEPSTNFLGLPIFELAPRFAAQKRFLLSEDVGQHVCDFVKANGDISFFERNSWKKALCKEFTAFRPEEIGKTISGKEYQDEIARDLSRSREIIEEKLPGKKVQHLCYPWFMATEESLLTAHMSCYVSAFLGVDAYSLTRNGDIGCNIKIIQRLPEYYIFLLPGKGRENLFNIFAKNGVFRKKMAE